MKNILTRLDTGVSSTNGENRDLISNQELFESIPPDSQLPSYPEDTNEGKLICFFDATYGNDPTKRRSITGYAFTYSSGAIVYRSKAQPIVALSSTEA